VAAKAQMIEERGAKVNRDQGDPLFSILDLQLFLSAFVAQ
jgi:hypothetical protein